MSTATPLEVLRTAIAAMGLLAALAVALFTIRDFRVLRREGINGPTGIVYAEKLVNKAVVLLAQSTYVGIGVAAMLAPPPIPDAVAAQVSETAASATLSVATYLALAVQGSVFVTSAMLVGSLWQLYSRRRLVAALRLKAAAPRTPSQQQAQQDRIEADGQQALALGRDTNARLRRGEIGRGEAALVDKATAARIEAAGDETVDRLRREGIGDETEGTP